MTVRQWIGILSISACSAALLTPGSALASSAGFTLDDLQLRSAGDLVDVCSVEQGNENYDAALAFCYGFFEGTIRYAEAMTGGQHHKKLVCPPEGTTRLEAVQVFVSHMKANEQYLSEPPVDAIYRALIPHWPCTP
jgi:hypothetical protein